MVKKVILILVSVAVFSASAFATELGGKVGLGVRLTAFTTRLFFGNNFAGELSMNYSSTTATGLSDSNQLAMGVGGMYVNEIYDLVLLEIGLGVAFMTGKSFGIDMTGYEIAPFVGFEYLIAERFGVDFKIFPFAYTSATGGGSTATQITALNANMGAHIYF